MALIDEIIKINVDRVRDTTPKVGFGIPFFLGESLVAFPNTVKSYSTLEDVLVDFTNVMPEYLAAKAAFTQNPRVTHILIAQKTDSATLLDAYNDAVLFDPNFFTVSIASAVEADILAIMAQVETQDRMFALDSGQIAILAGTAGNLGEVTHALGYFNTYAIWGEKASTEFPATAWGGKMLPKAPGSATWAYKNLAGVTGDKLFTPERAQLEAYNWNYYTSLASSNVTIGGKVLSGEWIDVVRTIYWVAESLELSLASLLKDVDKVPYTARGDGLIENAINSVLQIAKDNGAITDASYVTFTDIDTVPLANRTARIREGISIYIFLTGAIHFIKPVQLVVSD